MKYCSFLIGQSFFKPVKFTPFMNPRHNLIKSLTMLSKDVELRTSRKSDTDMKTIENDIHRTYFKHSKIYNNKTALKVYKSLLYEILTGLPVVYYQGMSEIAGVILEAFFGDKVAKIDFENEEFSANKVVRTMSDASLENLNKLRENHLQNQIEEAKQSKEADSAFSSETETVEEVRENAEINFDSEHFLFTKEINQRKFVDFKDKNKIEINTIKKSLMVLFEEKYIPLVKNNFKLYKENNAIFCEYARNNGIKIEGMSEFLTVKHILTFFTRDLKDINDIYTVFDIITRNDTTVVFSILAGLSNLIKIAPKMDQHEKCSLPADFENIVKQKTIELKETKEGMKSNTVTSFLIAGAVTSAAAVALAYFFKKD